ncbi:ribonuclease H-like domain-containing protein [Catenaria anguillulae PL171]|uniref:Ribonuclease H-like domain-containing protein n=1 Tax=Catenaria anguillulae PL171 TaxID=765915 RepID=A0A1Y2HFJ9_9FUNG|nr:ribonuclease H-like domain-containing protein [Catenaria anguillulae PL171]
MMSELHPPPLGGTPGSAAEDPDVPFDPTPNPHGLSTLTRAELVAQLEALGLPTVGNKEALKKRLRDHRRREAERNKANRHRSGGNGSGVATKKLGIPTLSADMLDEEPKLDAALADGMDKLSIKAEGTMNGGEQSKAQVADEQEDALSVGPDWILVMDFEATCEPDKAFNYFNEIIEFPCLLLNRHGDFVAEFHSYVRPTLNPKLSEYCSQLTGVTQEQVDAAQTWPTVLHRFEQWLMSRGVVTPDMLDRDNKQKPTQKRREKVLVACDGPWDVRDFARRSCDLHSIPTPFYFTRFLDLRRYVKRTVVNTEAARREAWLRPGADRAVLSPPLTAATLTDVPSPPPSHAASPPPTPTPSGPAPPGNQAPEYSGTGGLDALLAYFGMTFEGRPHCGRDDTRNIARVVQAIIRGGYVVAANWQRVNKSGNRQKQMLVKDAGFTGGRVWEVGDEQWIWQDVYANGSTPKSIRVEAAKRPEGVGNGRH